MQYMNKLANIIGQRILTTNNPIVASPPGRIEASGRKNIIVATPMRSGTHILIDIIINNISEYRRKPLYVDLDRYAPHISQGDTKLGVLNGSSGYVVKTHFPIGVRDIRDNSGFISDLAKDAIVLSVRRDLADIERSLSRWASNEPHLRGMRQASVDFQKNTRDFWAFWESRTTMFVNFPDLFDDAAMRKLLHAVAGASQTRPGSRYVGPPKKSRRSVIYIQKGLTRLLGAAAPRVNTTIFSPE